MDVRVFLTAISFRGFISLSSVCLLAAPPGLCVQYFECISAQTQRH